MKLRLKSVLESLSLRSVESVQDGNELSAFDSYMHVERPIEAKLRKKMHEIEDAGGGIILLVGSAGDGKSHLISRMKKEFTWEAGCYYNDATASCSPHKTAIETLKESLVQFKDATLMTTGQKLLLAINLGKLNAFIDEDDVKAEYSTLVKATEPIFDEDDSTPPLDTERVKIVMFPDEQIFEFYTERSDTYPVNSIFLSTVLEKITAKDDRNPFYKAYCEDLENGVSRLNPIILNYEILMIPEVRHSIEMTLIEAIIRFKLLITPREFLDFLYSIIVPLNVNASEVGHEVFYESLLPTLMYTGSQSLMQMAVSQLDPLKYSSTVHDNQLSILFTAYTIPDDYMNAGIDMIPSDIIKLANKLYTNGGDDVVRTAKFVYRAKHILHYHSESSDYKAYLSLLRNAYEPNADAYREIDSLVTGVIPRHYGSYYEKQNMVPLNIQGGKYRLFAPIELELLEIKSHAPKKEKNNFYLRFTTNWMVGEHKVPLLIDFQMYTYLQELSRGKLALSYENEKNLEFSAFISKINQLCDSGKPITIVRSDYKEIVLSEKFNTLLMK